MNINAKLIYNYIEPRSIFFVQVHFSLDIIMIINAFKLVVVAQNRTAFWREHCIAGRFLRNRKKIIRRRLRFTSFSLSITHTREINYRIRKTAFCLKRGSVSLIEIIGQKCTQLDDNEASFFQSTLQEIKCIAWISVHLLPVSVPSYCNSSPRQPRTREV